MSVDALEKAKREAVRWRVLKTLDMGRPAGVAEELLLTILNDVALAISPAELRRELDYLRDRKLIELKGEGTPVWSAQLTRLGVDLVEYTVDCDPGIARPSRW